MNRLIALIEDNPADAALIRSHLERLSLESGEHLELKHFPAAGAFLSSYQPIYDVVLMDIQLTDLSGMDAAKLLRKIDSQVVLLFVTSLSQYAVEGYEVSALDFMVKPVSFASFQRKMKRALAATQPKENEIILNLRDGVLYRTSSSRIKYIEIQSHNILIHTTDGNLESYGSLKHLEAELDSTQFVRCHSSYLVNLAYVRAIQGKTVSVDGDELPISKLKRQDFLQALNQYLGGKL